MKISFLKQFLAKKTSQLSIFICCILLLTNCVSQNDDNASFATDKDLGKELGEAQNSNKEFTLVLDNPNLLLSLPDYPVMPPIGDPSQIVLRAKCRIHLPSGEGIFTTSTSSGAIDKETTFTLTQSEINKLTQVISHVVSSNYLVEPDLNPPPPCARPMDEWILSGSIYLEELNSQIIPIEKWRYCSASSYRLNNPPEFKKLVTAFCNH